MYEHDREDIDVLGWEEFVLRQWESIFLGYRRGGSVRTVGRRWCDLIEVGIGCSQQIADEFVRVEIIGRADHVLFDCSSASELLAEMTDLVNALPDALSQMPEIPPEELEAMIKQHARLVSVVAGEPDPDEEADPDEE